MTRALALLACLVAGGCLAYNDSCPTQASETVGTVDHSLDLRQATLEAGEAMAGDLVADAFLAETAGADLALVPANALSDGSVCGARAFIDRGKLSLADVQALLPGDDSVVLSSVSSEELKSVLERSVSTLGNAPGLFLGFLQVSGVLFSADCSGDAQALSADGKSIVTPGARVAESSIFVRGQAIQAGAMWRVATLSSLGTGPLGYVDLAGPGHLLLDTHKKAADVLADYLRARSPITAGLDGRIALRDSCRAMPQ